MPAQYLKQDLVGAQFYEALPETVSWEERAIEHLMNLQTGVSALGADPMSEENAKENFQLRRNTFWLLLKRY